MSCVICFSDDKCTCYNIEEVAERELRKEMAEQSDKANAPRDYKLPKHDDELVD